MAGRQFKEGIDFFYFDTDFFTNNKMQLIEAEFGIKGTVIALRLLCKIYNNKGYYYQWGGDECLLFSRAAGAEFVPSAVNEIVNGLVRRRFFDKRCFDTFGILTSQSIQNIYIQATERRKSVDLIKEYLLLSFDKKPINVNIISINVDINTNNDNIITQSKVKYNKEILSIESTKKTDAVASPPSQRFINFQNWLNKNAPNVAKMREPFTQEQIEAIYSEFPRELIKKIILDMHNWRDLVKKNVSANLTFRKWEKKESVDNSRKGSEKKSEFRKTIELAEEMGITPDKMMF